MCCRCTAGVCLCLPFSLFLAGWLLGALGAGFAQFDAGVAVGFLGIGLIFLSGVWGVCVCYGRCTCCYQEYEDPRSSLSIPVFGTFRSRGRPDHTTLNMRLMGELDQKSQRQVHQELTRLLEKELTAQDGKKEGGARAEEEEDVPTICDRLMDRWHLPHDPYSMFDVALLSHMFHSDERYSSVKQAARLLLRRDLPFIKISTEFKRNLLEIRSNRDPEDYTPLANIYVLLKFVSDNENQEDFSPRSLICSSEETVGEKGKSPSAPLDDENNGKCPSAPPDDVPEGATPTVPPNQSDTKLDIEPPDYKTVEK